MNEIVNKFLLTGEKFMPKMLLKCLDLHIVCGTIYKKQRKNTKI